MRTFALAKAQMAESVDALVSNTSGATHPGSIPGLGTKYQSKSLVNKEFMRDFFLYAYLLMYLCIGIISFIGIN